MEDFSEFNLIGKAPVFLDVLRLISKFCACDATVLVQGETGTGKELAARAIHYLSRRRGHPFIPVNCGALPDTLVENELFGHVRGAFTDAREHRVGLVGRAQGGTLFLDEIESLSPKAQVVLLRFLQDGTYQPLGGKELLVGDARVVAASNIEIGDLVKTGTFRQDLLYRLALLTVRMPALRERRGDPRVLAEYFLAQFERRGDRAGHKLDANSLERLASHSWPGNVRELENLVHRALLMAEGSLIHLFDDAPAAASATASSSPALVIGLPAELSFRRAKALVVAQFEREFVTRALCESGGNVSAAARMIGKERRAFGRLLSKYGIDRANFD
ncbi:MAG: sigma-54 dependent transcriptional regulator [Betaproteobacteria bacterium]